jgi:hypothetical protein
LSFKIDRADVPQGGVTPFTVVELLQTGENMLPRDILGRVRCPLSLSTVEADEKRFHDGIVKAVFLFTYALATTT